MEGLVQALEGVNASIPDYSVGSFFLSLLLAYVLGQLTAWVYVWTHAGLSYSRTFTQSLVMMTMIVSLVMFVIGNSIIAAFGLLGALAIIRFRNVLKDTRDTMFVFLALVLGMACGMQRYLTAVGGTLTLLAVMAFLSWTGFGTFGRFDGYLTLRWAPQGGGEGGVSEVLRGFCRATKQVSLQNLAPGTEVESVYQIGLKDRDRSEEFLAALRGLQGVTEASLVLRDELSEV